MDKQQLINNNVTMQIGALTINLCTANAEIEVLTAENAELRRQLEEKTQILREIEEAREMRDQ